MKHCGIMKKIIAFASTLTILFGSFSTAVFAEEAKPANDDLSKSNSTIEMMEVSVDELQDGFVVYLVEDSNGDLNVASSNEIDLYSTRQLVAQVALKFNQTTSETGKFKWTVTLIDQYGAKLKEVHLSLFCTGTEGRNPPVYLTENVSGNANGRYNILTGESKSFWFPGETTEFRVGWTSGTFTCNVDSTTRLIAPHTTVMKIR